MDGMTELEAELYHKVKVPFLVLTNIYAGRSRVCSGT